MVAVSLAWLPAVCENNILIDKDEEVALSEKTWHLLIVSCPFACCNLQTVYYLLIFSSLFCLLQSDSRGIQLKTFPNYLSALESQVEVKRYLLICTWQLIKFELISMWLANTARGPFIWECFAYDACFWKQNEFVPTSVFRHICVAICPFSDLNPFGDVELRSPNVF